MARRANGEGNVRQRSNRLWEASVMLGGRRYYATGSTEAKVRRQLRDLHSRHSQGTLTPPTRLTVQQHLEQWLESNAADWKPRTLEYNRSNCRLYLTPAFGRYRLQNLSSQDIARQFARWRESKTVSGGTLLNVYKTLHRALTVAVRWGRLPRNPADGMEPPKAVRAVPQMWSGHELRAFLEAASGDRCEIAWALLIGTGARLGEVLALRWEDLDQDSRLIIIQRSAAGTRDLRIETSPKTRAGTRVLSLPETTLLSLKQWRRSQLEERMRLGTAWSAGDLVLTRPDGSPATPDYLRWAFKQSCASAGVRLIRLHDMRHLHASLLLAGGHSLPAVAARLGHASPSVTASVYAHLLPGQDRDAAAMLDVIMKTS